MLRSTVLAATACLSILGALAVPAVADKSQGWSDISAGTAMAYCLAKHTGVKAGPDGYSADGFEVATSGIVGSIRRNFVFDRSKPSTMSEMNIGQDQTCEQACNQLGQIYNYGETPLAGSALRYRPEGSPEQPSGIGDHVQLAMHDWEVDKRVVSGFWSRPQSYQTQAGGAVDHCCCQAVEAKQTAK